MAARIDFFCGILMIIPPFSGNHYSNSVEECQDGEHTVFSPLRIGIFYAIFRKDRKKVLKMIQFKKLELSHKPLLDHFLIKAGKEACEYSFANLYLWGSKKIAQHGGFLLILSQFDRRNVYIFPVGEGDLKGAVDAVIHDAAKRGIRCCLAALTGAECDLMEQMYPGKFRFYCDRDTYDYVYAIDDLADLKGRKFQKKRNHLNRFRQEHGDAQILPLDESNREAASRLAEQWYRDRTAADPDHDYHLEHWALHRAFAHHTELGMDGVVLMEHGQVLAFAMGSRLNGNTFDVHFEKALHASDGVYAAINQGFASYIREKYPDIKWLNREDDLGIAGLRKAKLSYNPDHMVEKCWAELQEEEDDC